jgi:hypothetical protein
MKYCFNKCRLIAIALLGTTLLNAQTKVGGVVLDEDLQPVAFANLIFKNSTQGTITNENGRFYMESPQRWDTLLISYVGYARQEIVLEARVNLNLQIELLPGEALREVVVFSGKMDKKNNPAVALLRKIWSKKRVNGLFMFDQYSYDEYEKIGFDLNTIDSALMRSRLFKGLEFVFDDLDTSRITGKTYLPVFINEKVSKIYGDNVLQLEQREVLGNKNSGFSNNQAIIAFVQDLYSDYNIYDNYLKFFDKSFVSPLATTGVDTYNYVLADSAFIDSKWCYNVVFYPRRKNELTFKGDFWVNDSTFAIKKINLAVNRSANLNWVKDIYIEQEFEVLSDSVFLLKRDYMLTDFALNKKEESRGVYGKRTTVYDNYVFNIPKPKDFYKPKPQGFDLEVYERDGAFWEQNRLELLNEDDAGVYELLDTLKTVPRFKSYYNLVSILGSGYVELDSWNIDLGDIYSTFGYNPAEGIRIRGGARTFFGQNDLWRLEGYGAYGFLDRKFKYGLSGKWLLDQNLRLTLSGGNQRDVEQMGLNLTSTTDVMGRSAASGSVLTVGSNNRLTRLNRSTFAIGLEPFKNLRLEFGAGLRDMQSALPEFFSLDYLDPEAPDGIASRIKQFDVSYSLFYTPGKETIGYGVERRVVNDTYSNLFLRFTRGLKGPFNSDFNYSRLQFSYTKPWQLGGFGRLMTTLEAGKTYGSVPLGLLHVIPGNQTYFTMFATFPNLDFYEFVTDAYLAAHVEHNFNGRLFSRIPILRNWNLREIVGFRTVWGTLSEANRVLSSPANLTLVAPSGKAYWEYALGVGNIFKFFRVDFNFRGNYLQMPNSRRFGVTGAFGFHF